MLRLLAQWSIFAMLGALPASAELRIGSPLVKNEQDNARAIRGPVWALTKTADGTLLVGSNILSAFDGSNWEPVNAPGYAFRALAAAPNGDVWVGARGAIGRLARDAQGSWQFESLYPHLKAAGISDLGDVWLAHSVGAAVIFVTSEKAIRWNGQKAEVWSLPAKPHLQAFPAEDGVLIYQLKVGLFRLGAAGAPELIKAEADLPASPVTWFLSQRDGSALLGLGEAAYRMTSTGALTRLDALSQALQKTLPCQAEQIDRTTIAIGTYKAGVVVATTAGIVQTRIDHAAGLTEDSVYSLHNDALGVLWIGLGHGLARAVHPGTAAVIDAHHGLDRGYPLRVVSNGESTVVVNSRNLYALPAIQGSTDRSSERLRPILDTPEIFTGAVVLDDHLWCSGFGGLWRMDAGTAVRHYRTPTDVLAITTSARVPGILVFVEGYELKSLQASSFGWGAKELGLRLPDTVASLLEDEKGVLWLSTIKEGILRAEWVLRPTEPPSLRLSGHYKPGLGLPATTLRPILNEVGGRLFAFTENEILERASDGKSFIPAPGMNGLTGLFSARVNATSAYWLVQTGGPQKETIYALIRVDATTPAGQPLPWAPIRSGSLDQIVEPISLSLTGDPARHDLWIGGKQGLVHLTSDAIREARSAPNVFLRTVALDGRPQPFGMKDAPHVYPATSKQLEFRFAVDGAAGRTISYQTRLEPVEGSWSPPTRETRRGFTGLAAGDYTFRVRALDRFGRAGPDANYNFGIALPWYFRPPAIAGYLLVAGVLGLVVLRLRTRHLQLQNERLNRLVEERTRELELANTAKSEFLESVSHEIRNPLNGLNGLLNMLRQEDLGSSARQLMGSVQACALGLTRVFEEVLGYSKLEYGVIPPKNAPFSARKIIEEIAASFAWHASQQGSPLKCEIPAEFTDGFQGDENRIKTIVTNFVGNAIKYAPGKPIVLRLESHATGKDLVEVHFEVTDHGPGISPKEQGLIFKKFVRGSTAKKGNVAGTGLGLATCRVLAKSIDGSVGVDSEPGKGATFYLRVPLRPVALPAKDPSAEPVLAGRALIVEDEHYNQVVLRGIAIELGLEADVASNAEQAEASLAAKGFDIIFLDWELPGLKGGELAQRIRTRAGGATPVIIAVTAHDSPDIRRQCVAMGMDDFLSKPYDLGQVRARIVDSVARRSNGPSFSLAQPNAIVPNGSNTGNRLNLRAFEHYARGAPGQSGHATELYFTALEEEEEALRKCLAAGNAADLAVCAHRMRALGGLVGGKAVADAARQLETAANSGQPQDWKSAYEALTPQIAALKAELQSLTPSAGARG